MTVSSGKPPSQIYTVMAVPSEERSVDHWFVGYLDELQALRKARGLSQARLAEMVGVEQPTIQRWEKGKRLPDLDHLQALATALGVTPGSLLDGTISTPLGPQLWVKGEVAAGVWRSAVEMPREDWQSFTGRADVTADAEHRFGLRVVSDSMDLIYPPGTIVECVSLFGRAEATPGKRVVIIRMDDHGHYESTVKELVERDGKLWAVPRSSNPAHGPIDLSQPEPGIVETRIAAVVVASIRPE